MAPRKPIYNVFLVDLPDLIAPDDRARLASILKGYFDEAARAARYVASSVTWPAECPVLAGEELLIYFVRDYRDSVLSCRAPACLGGMTYWKSETASEVYIHDAGGTPYPCPVLANLAFHEALHNKTHLDDAGLHPIGGLAGSSISASTTLTPAVKSLMAAALPLRRRQLTAAWAGYSLADRPYLLF